MKVLELSPADQHILEQEEKALKREDRRVTQALKAAAMLAVRSHQRQLKMQASPGLHSN